MTADVIVCVYNALADVRVCLDAARKDLSQGQKLIIVNDRSDESTTAYLRSFAKNDASVVLIENDENQGYTKSANIGLAASTADFRVMLNSDTIVSPNWLKKMINVAFSDDCIGIVGPMSNAASWQSIPNIEGKSGQTAINAIPNRFSLKQIDDACEKWASSRPCAVVPLVHGFCFGLKKSVIDEIGYFDDVNFERYYGEENDYCFRARKAGFALAIATDVFVFHQKSKSIEEEERLLWMSKASAKFRELHGKDAVALACDQMRHHPILVYMRARAAKLWSTKSLGERSVFYVTKGGRRIKSALQQLKRSSRKLATEILRD